MLDRADLRVPTPGPRRSSISTSVEPVAAARTPAVDPPTPSDELARLRKRVDQQQHSLTVMAEAISALRDGSEALRQENRELRLALQATQRSSTVTGRSQLRARDLRLEPGALPFESELRARAEIARREPQAPHHRTGA